MALDTYIQNFLRVIREFRYDNTYKLVWSKSIVALCSEGHSGEIQLTDIASKVFPLYWNLHIFFDPDGKTLRQGTNHQKTPEILQYVLGKVEEYREYKGESYKPVFFEQKQHEIEDLGIDYPKVSNILRKDVAYRFLNLGARLSIFTNTKRVLTQ